MSMCAIFAIFQCCSHSIKRAFHYNDVIMGAMASQIFIFAILYSTVYSGAELRKHQSSASLAFVRRIHRWPLNSPHKRPVTRKLVPFDDFIMYLTLLNKCRSRVHYHYSDLHSKQTPGQLYRGTLCPVNELNMKGPQYVWELLLRQPLPVSSILG